MKKLLIILFAITSIQAQAHSGRTNSQGCHNDNINGGYHCHGGSDKKTYKSELRDLTFSYDLDACSMAKGGYDACADKILKDYNKNLVKLKAKYGII